MLSWIARFYLPDVQHSKGLEVFRFELQIGFLFLEANLPFPCGMMNAHVHKFIFYVLILIAFWTFFLLFHRFDFSFSWFAPMISLPGGLSHALCFADSSSLVELLANKKRFN
jgi:hypothetical protein